MKKQELPKWFKGEVYDKGGIVKNPFSNVVYKLNNIELTLYDFIMGSTYTAEMGIFNTPHHVKQLRKGLDWFRKNNAEAYMVLLD